MEINKFKSTTLFCAMLSLYGCGGGTTTPDPLPEVEVEVEVEQANVI
ncbi:MAG: hypothetical protein HRT35_18780, partial [Algicola sp.]|nr:hypothetical protein [Algicola sp.]